MGMYVANEIRNFNSQPHKEADRDKWEEYVVEINFNSQPHKEADQQFYSIKIASFNSFL